MQNKKRISYFCHQQNIYPKKIEKIMKRIITLIVAAAAAACSSPKLYVALDNPTVIDRHGETVEIAWSDITSKIGDAAPESIIVLDDEAQQIPSQIICLGSDEPQSLIFQADVEPLSNRVYSITKGQREEYTSYVYGRQVPERYDDYAWENDRAAYRLYGPALETSPEKLITPGIDIWVKRSDKLVINDRYERADYHHDNGDGLDCYKVGVTLGGGGCVPFVDGELCMMTHNYVTCRTLDNGPLRTTVELTYAPFTAGDAEVTLTKVISLDKGRWFNRMDNVYTGEFESLPIAAGFVRHDVKEMRPGDGCFAFVEAASDSQNPAEDGDIYGAIVLPDAQILPEAQGHALAVKEVAPGQTLTYYAGSGWSKGGIADMDEWEDITVEQLAAAIAPLQVKLLMK